MFCTNCGANLPDGVSFCTSCGNPIKKNDVPQMQPVQPVQAAPAEPVVAPTPVQPVQAAPVEPVVAPTPVQPVQAAPVEPVVAPTPVQPVQAAPVEPVVAPTPVQPVQPVPVQPVATPVQPVVTPVQPTPVQPTPVQPTPAASANTAEPPKKKNLGKILGLAIGIPVGVLTLLIAGGCIACSVCTNNLIKEASNITSQIDIDDPEPVIQPTVEPTVEPEPISEPVTEAEISKYTVMMYFVGSNLESTPDGDIPGCASSDLYEMMDANIPEDANVIVQCGGTYYWDNPAIPDETVSRVSIKDGQIEVLEDLGQIGMTEEGALEDFINFCKENYPAEGYSLVLWNHGGGIPVGFGMDYFADDFYDTMSDYEIRNEIAAADIHLDALIFDACNMCTLEMGMAAKDYADYMVGAESVVNGVGIYYTNWLEMLDGQPLDFCEKIVDDYMDKCHERGLLANMAVIKLSGIQNVYDEYVEYIQAVDEEVNYYDDYVNYYKSRGNCGYFEGNDAIDIVTLTNSYPVGNYSDLMNAAISCTDNVQCDYSYGHGLMVYSPYSVYRSYTKGRQSFLELGYDDSVVNFYDKFVSKELAYLGDDYVSEYAGSWYVGDYTEEVAEAGGEAGEYTLNLTPLDYYYGIALTDDSWDLINTVEESVLVIDDDGRYQMLGQDYLSPYPIDSEGYIALVDPQTWVGINNYYATYIGCDFYQSDDTWSQSGMILATVNGYEAYLYVYFDPDYPTGIILGYYYVDFETNEIYDDTMYSLEDDDIVDLVCAYYDAATGEISYEANDDPVYASDLEVAVYYTELDDYTTYGYITITDVYGNIYETDMVALGSYNAYQ